ncbi:EthD family reductase [Mesorhizobium sp. CGMCC 1.15528]|uniref:EthD family reductase n=1 Tax=Mesorhizobium zhangyense TaxID=1776730 RepID=A0A7C9VG24_9HYPH|nr:EthD domain-containing protein [Mesorhizobium zhangyense]NGN44569.1 EthD family reductase [Mesorhizobium zhangyense]
MIRKFVFLKRKPGLTHQAFRDHWHGPHASVISTRPEFWKDTARYVQNRVLPAVADVTPEPQWDGLVQIELKDGAPSSAEIRDDPRNKEVSTDEGDFVDTDQRVQFFAEEKVVVDGPTRGVKILSLPRRRAGLSPAEFSRHYREVHGELVRRNEAFTKYANRYVQHHLLADTVKATGGFVPYDGISEFWFDSLDHAKAAWAAPSYMAELRSDEKNFVGSPPSHRLIVEEIIVVPGR